jgi:dihydrofolate reductase
MTTRGKFKTRNIPPNSDADTYFTEINDENWAIDSKEFHNKDEKNEYNYTFINYARTR